MILAPLVLALSQESLVLPGPYRAGSEAAWVVEQEGKRIGECRSRYEGEVALGSLRAHLFREQVRLQLPSPGAPLEQRFTMDLWTNAAGRPLRFDFRAQLADARSRVEGVFTAGQAEFTVFQGPIAKTSSVAVAPEAFLLANNFVGEIELVLALTPLKESRSVTLFSVNTGQTFPYVLRPVETLPEGVILEDSLGERLHFVAGRLERVEIPAQKIEFRRTDERLEGFTIEPPARPASSDALEREEVTIVDGPVSLAGTITRPKGATGRLPAVTFLSGSGAQDREGFAGGIDLGTHEILDRLTREGFLVLRVDDRGAGRSTGPLDGLTFDDLVEDGRRLVRFLRARADVDPARVALLGHSEGGVSGPILAADEELAALVLLAAPGRPIDVLLREQLLSARGASGASAEVLARFGGEIDAFLSTVARGAPEPAGLPPELAAFVPRRAWLKSHLGRDPLAPFPRLRCPVLVLQGARDVQVLAERDTPAIVAALEAGHVEHEVHVFPTLDHLFKRASDPPSELDYLKSRPVDPEFLDRLAAWLRARLLP